MNRLYFILAFAFLISISCRKDPATEEITDPLFYNSDWSKTSHGNEAPDYSVAFPQDHINTIEISIGTAKWASIRTNMKRHMVIVFAHQQFCQQAWGGITARNR